MALPSNRVAVLAHAIRSDGAQQEVKRQPNVAHHFIPQSRHGNAPAPVGTRKLLLQATGDGGHLGLRLLHRHADFQPADGKKVLPATRSGWPNR